MTAASCTPAHPEHPGIAGVDGDVQAQGVGAVEQVAGPEHQGLGAYAVTPARVVT